MGRLVREPTKIRLSDDESRVIDAAAERAGIPTAVWIREAALAAANPRGTKKVASAALLALTLLDSVRDALAANWGARALSDLIDRLERALREALP